MAGFDRNDAVTAAGLVLTTGGLFMAAGIWAVVVFVGLAALAVGAYRGGNG